MIDELNSEHTNHERQFAESFVVLNTLVGYGGGLFTIGELTTAELDEVAEEQFALAKAYFAENELALAQTFFAKAVLYKSIVNRALKV